MVFDIPPAIIEYADDILLFMGDYMPELTRLFTEQYKKFIIERTLKLEGGAKYTQHVENGRVTPTKYGVTLFTLRKFKPNATAEDVKALTLEEAIRIYDSTYWKEANVEVYPVILWDLIFDGNINHGPTGMARVTQRALNDLGQTVKIDGRIGPNSMKAIHAVDPVELRKAILNRRERLYSQLPDFHKFGRGWMNRLEQIREIPKQVAV
jgi:lysozyme family protein